MEHFITSVHINEVRHLKNIEIKLNPEKRQHLILTGKNGSGKTSVLQAMKSYLLSLSQGNFNHLKNDYPKWIEMYKNSLLNAQSEAEKYTAKKDLERTTAQMLNYNKGICWFVENCSEIYNAQILKEGKLYEWGTADKSIYI